MPYPGARRTVKVDLIGNPIKFSESEVEYRDPPPKMGDDTEAVLKEAGLSGEEIASLRNEGVV